MKKVIEVPPELSSVEVVRQVVCALEQEFEESTAGVQFASRQAGNGKNGWIFLGVQFKGSSKQIAEYRARLRDVYRETIGGDLEELVTTPMADFHERLLENGRYSVGFVVYEPDFSYLVNPYFNTRSTALH